MENFKTFKCLMGTLRVCVIKGEPWFVAKDVAVALGYKDPINAIKLHVYDEDKMRGWQNTTPYIIDKRGIKQYPTLINESGVYALIFGSKLPFAKEFKRWVTKEVLPSIRKNGGYIDNQEKLSKPEQDEIKKLVAEIYSAVNSKLEYRTRLWHAAVAERNAYKERYNKYKHEAQHCRSDADYWFEMYTKLLSEMEDLYPAQPETETAYANRIKSNSTFRVDSNGFISVC